MVVSRDEAQARIESGEVTVIDVRSPKLFAAAHIDGALNFPLIRLAEAVKEAGLVADAHLIVTGRTDAESERGAAVLREVGFSAVEVLEGGFHRWVAEQRPCNPKASGYACGTCSYGYYPHRGDPMRNIEEGTLFDELPDMWRCPWCGALKSRFFKEP